LDWIKGSSFKGRRLIEGLDWGGTSPNLFNSFLSGIKGEGNFKFFYREKKVSFNPGGLFVPPTLEKGFFKVPFLPNSNFQVKLEGGLINLWGGLKIWLSPLKLGSF